MTEAEVIERMNAGQQKERRFRPDMIIELRAAGAEGEPTVITGHPAVFNQTADLGWFRETVKPGAFTKTIAQDDIRALFNHNPDYVIGRNKAGTLTLTEDEQGLRMDIIPPDTTFARDLMANIRAGNISQGSIGFYVRGYQLTRGDDGVWERDLTDVMLFDVSPVTYPAYEGTDMNLRSASEIVKTFRSGPDNPKPDELEWRRQVEHRQRMLALAEY